MASAVDIKIDAVFSLAEGGQSSEDTMATFEDAEDVLSPIEVEVDKDDGLANDSDPFVNEFGDSEDIIPDADEVDVVSGLQTATETLFDSSTDTDPGLNENSGVNVCTPRALKGASADPDVPPPLSLEKDNSVHTPYFKLDEHPVYLSPPVLQPEEPLKAETTRHVPKKTYTKKCKKIAPCYIVLTNIDPIIGPKSSVTIRAFKRQFNECSNMCKKTHFKRRLEAGKDVFNVKAPSKQKDYYIHLVNLEHEQARKSKQKIVQFPDLKYLMEKHELKMSKKNASPEKKTLNRVRRVITKLPKDFVIRPNSPNFQEEVSIENREALSAEELEAFNARMASRKHKLELSSLKKLIGIKRSMNKQSKKYRKNKKDGLVAFLKSDVTSSVSGRVRRSNKRYEGDYALVKDDIDQQLSEAKFQAQLKRAENENKKMVEDIQKESERFEQKRKRSLGPRSEEEGKSSKRAKAADVVIDNPEEGHVKEFKKKKSRKQKTNKLSKPDVAKKQSKFIYSVVDPNVGYVSELRRRLLSSGYKEKRVGNTDGVLIQDLPKEENVISGFLQNSTFGVTSLSPSRMSQDNAGTSQESDHHIDRYPMARQLLKDSLAKQTLATRSAPPLPLVKIKVEPGTEPIETTSTTDQEKYKMLKIPENVQRLFIKKEPGLDEEQTSSSKMTNTPHVVNVPKNPIVSNAVIAVTVAYTNGTNKRVLLTSNSNNTSGNLTSLASNPVFINTYDGSRYFLHTPAQKTNSDTKMTTVVSAPHVLTTATSSLVSALKVSQAHPNSITPSTCVTQQQPTKTVKSVNQSAPPQIIYLSNGVPGPRPPHFSGIIPTVVQLPVPSSANAPLVPIQSQSIVQQKLPMKTALPGQQRTVITHPQTSLSKAQQFTPVPAPSSTTAIRQSLLQTKPNQVTNSMIRANSVVKAEVGKQPVVSNTTSSVVSQDQNKSSETGQKSMDKCKFYLLKIDGKNVLIPIEGDKAQPKAYVVNSDILTNKSDGQQQSTTRPITLSNTNASSTGPAPTTTGSSIGVVKSIGEQQCPKIPITLNSVLAANIIASPTGPVPTLIGAPVVLTQTKPILAVPPNLKEAATSNVVGNNGSQPKSLYQTYTLLPANTNAQSGVKTVMPYNPPVLNFISSTSTSSIKKQVCAPVIVDSQGKVVQPGLPINAKVVPISSNHNFVPVYLQPVSSTAGIQANTVPHIAAQVDSSTKKPGAKEVLNSKIVIANKQVVTQNSAPRNMSLLQPQPLVSGTKKDLKIVNTLENGIVVVKQISEEKRNENSQAVEKPGDNPKAFLEGVTAREEKLRKLKELLKEKQKAVEEIRSSKTKNEESST